MKSLILVLVACLPVFFFSCQENLINQPETSQIQKDNLPLTNSIKICCEVKDPRYGVCNLNGCVDFTLEIIREAMHPRAIHMVSVKLYMNTILCDKLGMVHLEWRAEDRTEDIVYVSEDGIVLLEKSYWITNRNDVVLLVKYLVTTNGIGIADANLVSLEK
ncbi:MAG: hypothetical protein IPM14_06305 [bacterium]|nr:hypothetical protein [bacterium]